MDTTTLLTLAPTAASLALYGTMLGGFAAGMRRRRAPYAPERAPAVSILKPLAGADDELEENLASFAALDYPNFEILLGVASSDDPAWAVARRFVARHPRVAAKVVLTDRDAATNPKVAQLVGLDRQARGEIVVVSDSNVRVSRGYLWSLVRELETPGVGLATSVFAGTGERSVGAALENLQIGAHVGPGIVAVSLFSKRPFTVGKSMAIRRRDLARLGGFARTGAVLAEDHVMGRMFLDAGIGVRTSFEAVENRNVDCSVRRTLERHTRWAKMRRALQPLAFAFEPLLSPLLVATAVAVLAQSKLAVAVACAVALLQTLLAFSATRLLRGHGMRWAYAPLEIVRTYLVFVCWLAACVSRRIEWRGHPFLVLRGSRIVPAPKGSRLRAAARLLAG